MRVGIISQARMTSTRLPGKVLLPAADQPLLLHHVTRLRQSAVPVYLAITENSADDVLADLATAHGLPCFRGSETDVLARYQQCAAANDLEVLVRVTSDCPLLDGELIAAGIAQYLAAADSRLYLSNVIERTYPRGFDFEIFSRELLDEAAANATLPTDREHVTPYLHQNRAGTVRLAHITRAPDRSAFRLTVDTADDYALIRHLIETYHAEKLNAVEIITLLEAHPELVALNAHVEQKKV